MRPLRFCFLTTFYPPYNFGGDGIGIQRLARGLVRAGHEVTIVHDIDAYNLLSGRAEPAPVQYHDGVETVPLKSGLGKLSCLLTQQTGHPTINGGKIRRILHEGDFDVVNFHNISLVGGPGLLSYGSQSLRLYMAHEHWLVCPTHVLWRHDRELCTGRQCVRCQIAYRRPPQAWRYTGFMDKQLTEVDGFIAVSEFSRDKHREFGFPYEMEVLNYFLPDGAPEPESFGPTPHERPYFLFVGRLEKIKGLDEVIPLFQRHPEADLLIAGDGEYAGALRRLGEGNDRVRFLGRIPLEELSRYYQNALALIVPSVCYETFGIIIIESFRHGTPVIARELGPFPEIIRRSGGGLLFSTTAELLKAMKKLQFDPDLRERFAIAGWEAYREHWVESKAIPGYLDIVRRTASGVGRDELLEALGPSMSESPSEV